MSGAPPLVPRLATPSTWRAVEPPLTLAGSYTFPLDTGVYPALDRVYFQDLLDLHGVEYRDELLDAPRTTYREMTTMLVERLGARAGRFDVAILAIDGPDAEPGWPMPYLIEQAADPGLAFAVSDQGPLVPFTALTLLADLARGPRAGALVLAMDQPARQHERPVPAARRAGRNAAAVLGFGPGPSDGSGEQLGFVRTLLRRDVSLAQAEAMTAEAAAGGLLVVGETLAGAAGPGARVAEPGAPCSGVWSAAVPVLKEARRSAAGKHVVVADYDVELGYFGMCDIEPVRGVR